MIISFTISFKSGTLALEVYEQIKELDIDEPVTSFIVPTGGGGMLAGVSLASSLESPETKIYSVEPEG
eukprot:Awhi_evm1s5720